MDSGSLRSEALSWAAGFYDGEGHCGAYKDKRDGSISLRLQVVQSSDHEMFPPETLLRFHDAMDGVGKIRKRSRGNKNHRPQWEWTAQNIPDQKLAIRKLAPHVGTDKRLQMAAAMAERAAYEVESARRRWYCKRGHLLERGVLPRNRCPTCYHEVERPRANRKRRQARKGAI